MRAPRLVYPLLCSAFFLLANCLSEVAPTNPYDPASPPALQAKATITGTVLGLSGDPNQPAIPLTGAAIKLDGPSVTDPITTSTAGSFSFSELTAGPYTITVAHPTHFPQSMSYHLTPGQVINANVQLSALDAAPNTNSAHITGVVHLAGQLVLPLAEQDHSGVSVEIQNTGVRVFTDTQGNFDILLTSGVYTMAFSAANYDTTVVPNVSATANSVTVLPNSPLVLPANPGGIGGTIQLEGRAANQWNGVTVSLFGIGTTSTTANGNYLFSNVAAGTYTLTASAPSYASQTLSNVAIRGGIQGNLPPLLLAIARGSLTGVVQLAGQNSYGGVKVILQSTQFVATTTTALDGSFTLAGVPTGTYSVIAEAPGFVSYTSALQTVANNTVTTVPTITMSSSQGSLTLNGGSAYTRVGMIPLVLNMPGATGMRISQDAGFANASLGDINFRTFASTSNFTLSAGDGIKTVYAQTLDALGAASNVLASTIILDTVPPVPASPATPYFQIDQGSPTTRVSGRITLTFAVTDATSGVVAMEIDTQSPLTTAYQPYVSSLVYTVANPTGDGNKVIYANFRDAAGNVLGVPANANIRLDTTPPILSAFSATCHGVTPATQCNSPLVTLNIASPDAVKMAFSDNVTFPAINWQPYSNVGQFLLDPGDGNHTVALLLQDAAGNLSTPVALTLLVDTQPPTSPSVTLNNGALYTNSLNVPIGVSALGATQVNISNCASFSPTGCNTSGWVNLASAPSTWTLQGSDGWVLAYAQFRDAAGNISSVATGSITLKRTPPTLGSPAVYAVVDASDFTNSISTLLQFNVQGAVQMQVGCDRTLAGAPWEPYAPTFTCLLPSGDGKKNIAIAFADNANNEIQPPTTTIYYDSTAPSPPVVERGSTVVNATTYTMSLIVPATDPAIAQDPNPSGPHIAYQLKGGQYDDWTDCGTALPALQWAQDSGCGGPPFTFELTQNTTTNLNVRARDRAGNLSTPVLIAVTEDSVAPNPPQTAHGSGAWVVLETLTRVTVTSSLHGRHQVAAPTF